MNPTSQPLSFMEHGATNLKNRKGNTDVFIAKALIRIGGICLENFGQNAEAEGEYF